MSSCEDSKGGNPSSSLWTFRRGFYFLHGASIAQVFVAAAGVSASDTVTLRAQNAALSSGGARPATAPNQQNSVATICDNSRCH